VGAKGEPHEVTVVVILGIVTSVHFILLMCWKVLLDTHVVLSTLGSTDDEVKGI
jgi:hypothetical protein